MKRLICVGVLLTANLLAMCNHSARASEQDDFFEAKIRPVLVGTCFRCHGGGKTSGDLRLDSRERLLKGGSSGPASCRESQMKVC